MRDIEQINFKITLTSFWFHKIKGVVIIVKIFTINIYVHD